MSILVIKNGKCNTDIKDIINGIVDDSFNSISQSVDLREKIHIDILHSSEISNNVAVDVNTRYNGVVILGGSQSLTGRDSLNYPYQYLNRLINYTKKWIDQNVHILGICLGAQIIAEAMGHKTKQLGYTESGYEKDIRLIDDRVVNDKLIRPNMYNKFKYVLSLHNDYCDIEGDTDLEVLATITDKKNKEIPYIFKVKNAYGLQFHPEITINVLKIYCKTFTFDGSMIEYARENLDQIKETSRTLIGNWLDLIGVNS